ncbi:MAG: FdrA family protein [Actinomycetota bacterium]|nr:FdrA family protein [Actinomycetota bacterium]
MSKDLQVRKGAYVDSVTLLQVSRTITELPGVTSALVAMATELNLELAAGMGFTLPAEAGPNEMLVAVDAHSDDALRAALAEVDVVLTASSVVPSSGFGSAPAPRTIAAAARSTEANVALISTPGQYAVADAIDAVDAGLHTMVFSDNVPVEQELALKRYAERAGVVVMGPDCGTAVIGGVGLGFANVVRPGPVGIVAASGTGAQHLMTLLDGAGVGISHCVGVGGRDLRAEVGGLSTLRALDLLAVDEATELVVVISKPPSDSVAHAVREHADSLGKPVLMCLLGQGQPNLTETARRVVDALGRTWQLPSRLAGRVGTCRRGHLRGLFTGGTLCDEAMILAADRLGPIWSNIALQPDWMLEPDLASAGHTMIDFGDDRLTSGRPHPMIDGSIRAQRLRSEVDDPTCAVLLLDVVLGLGAHLDPAAGLVDAVGAATTAGVPVVVSMVGTRDDPQDRNRSAAMLHEAGAWVHFSNAEATVAAMDLLETGERS